MCNRKRNRKFRRDMRAHLRDQEAYLDRCFSRCAGTTCTRADANQTINTLGCILTLGATLIIPLTFAAAILMRIANHVL